MIGAASLSSLFEIPSGPGALLDWSVCRVRSTSSTDTTIVFSSLLVNRGSRLVQSGWVASLVTLTKMSFSSSALSLSLATTEPFAERAGIADLPFPVACLRTDQN